MSHVRAPHRTAVIALIAPVRGGEPMKYYGDPTHLASLVEQSGILYDRAKR